MEQSVRRHGPALSVLTGVQWLVGLHAVLSTSRQFDGASFVPEQFGTRNPMS